MESDPLAAIFLGLFILISVLHRASKALIPGIKELRESKKLPSYGHAAWYALRKAALYVLLPSIVLTIVIVLLGLWFDAPGLRQG